MPVTMQFNVLGETQLQRTLLRFNQRALNATPAFASILDEMREQVDSQFASEGGRGSGGWAPLAASTIAFKSRMGYPLEILHRTMALRNSLTEIAPGSIGVVGPKSMIFGSAIPYGHFHQSGTRKMPRRRPVDFTEADRQKYVRMLQAYIVEGAVVND